MIYSVKHFFLLMCIVFTNIYIISGRFSTIYRHLWNAKDETKSLSRFRLPVKFYHATMCKTKACNSIESCSLVVYNLQEENMKHQGLPDIAYNFLVDGLGQVYEGTGWYSRAIAHEKEFLSICLFGIGNYKTLTKDVYDGLMNILDFGKEIGYLSQSVKPLFNLNQPIDIQANHQIEPQGWMKQLLVSLRSKPNTSKDESVSMETVRPVSDINWSKVFPNLNNKTIWNNIASQKRTIIKKSDWIKVFHDESQVASADWSSVLKNESINHIDWNEVFERRDFNLTNLNLIFSSSPARIHRRLGHNNNLL